MTQICRGATRAAGIPGSVSRPGPPVWKGLLMRAGETQYARSGEHHIAFRVVGDGDGGHEVVMVNDAFFPMESLGDDPVMARLLEGLAGLGRLVTSTAGASHSRIR